MASLNSQVSRIASRLGAEKQDQSYGGSSSSWGYLNSWMVYVGKSQSKMDDDWGYPRFFRKPPNIRAACRTAFSCCKRSFTWGHHGEPWVAAWLLPPNFAPVLSLGSWTSNGFHQQRRMTCPAYNPKIKHEIQSIPVKSHKSQLNPYIP